MTKHRTQLENLIQILSADVADNAPDIQYIPLTLSLAALLLGDTIARAGDQIATALMEICDATTTIHTQLKEIDESLDRLDK